MYTARSSVSTVNQRPRTIQSGKMNTHRRWHRNDLWFTTILNVGQGASFISTTM